jgi:hypothetical protein
MPLFLHFVLLRSSRVRFGSTACAAHLTDSARTMLGSHRCSMMCPLLHCGRRELCRTRDGAARGLRARNRLPAVLRCRADWIRDSSPRARMGSSSTDRYDAAFVQARADVRGGWRRTARAARSGCAACGGAPSALCSHAAAPHRWRRAGSARERGCSWCRTPPSGRQACRCGTGACAAPTTITAPSAD